MVWESRVSCGKSVVLTAGRPTPGTGGLRKREKGVAIVLSGQVIAAWRTAGEQWRSWSSRLVSTCLQTGSRKAGHLHELSCCTLTLAASRAAEDQFLQDLEHALALIPLGEPYILLRDFNAGVGSRSEAHDLWHGVHGPDGYGECNDAGKESLTFLAAEEASVCNTWFQKIHKQTWAASKVQAVVLY